MTEVKKITGRINIDVDDEGLLAVFHFIPDDEGPKWDLQALNRAVIEKKIVHGIDRKALDAHFAELLSSGAESNFTIAEGSPSEAPVPEDRNWAEISIPENRRVDVERVLKNAAPPEIYRTETEKVTQEKKVKKKSLLLFGREKEETVKEVIKREKKIKVDIIPEVLEAGWVESGTVLAGFTPGKPGNPGKDVYGKIIPAMAAGEDFWIGRNIESKSGKLKAVETGILRRGWNWAEVLPFKIHDWTLELTKDKNTCLLNFNPGGKEAAAPKPEDIFSRAEMLGCVPETLVSKEELSCIISTAISAGREIKAAIISTPDDGAFEITVSEDKLKAELRIHKSRGKGKPLNLKEIGAAIKTSGLKGLNLKKIQNIILEFYYGPESETSFVLTEGKAPEHGETGALSYDLEFFNDSLTDEVKKRAAQLSPEYLSRIDSAGQYPPSDVTALALVQEKQQIASIPLESGKKGTDVFGKEIEARAADISSLKVLENLKFEGGAIFSVSAGLLERFEKDGVMVFRIRDYRDSSMKFKVSADKMSAVIYAAPAVGGGRPPSLEDAKRMSEEAGVVQGIDNDSLRSVVEKIRGGNSVEGAVIAMGKPPKNAGERKLKLLIEMAEGKSVTISANGRADYRKQNKISSVKKGDLIAEIQIIQGESEDGWDVSGRTLAAKPLAPLNVEIGANVAEEKNENGNTYIVAEKAGRLIFENNRIEIQESIFIKGDVDFSIGNIKFSGDVHIKGTVKSGFYIMAGGDISIGMNSEMSLLSSEKNVAVAQGIKGGGKAIIRAKQSIQLSFAERATLLAVEDITIKNAVFNCKVKCNGKLRLMTDKGYLVGGRIQARGGIEAANIGSLSGSRTEVSFGQDYLIADRIEIEENEINKIKKRLIKIDPEMRTAEKNGDKKVLSGLRMEKVKLMKIMEKRSLRVFTLKERFEQHYPGEVTIRGDVFPGVVFESHGRYLEIKKNQKAVKIVFNQTSGMLEIVSLGNKD